jgi:hypothetical protein
MSNPVATFFAALWAFLRRRLGGQAPAKEERPPAVPPDNLTEPPRVVTNRVLLIVYDPFVDVLGARLSEVLHWNAVDELVNTFISDIRSASGGLARFEIVARQDLSEFPAKVDGYRYDAATYVAVVQGRLPPHAPDEADYQAILTAFNVLPRVAAREIDEVWLFGFPHAGFYESVMAGQGAFWCNAPPLAGTAACPRRFVIMGFSYERGVGEMLEAFGHRAEAILTRVFAQTQGEANLFERFCRYDRVAPGKAEVGTIHFAPNSTRDYEWGNPHPVLSNCYDWLNFPNFIGDVRLVEASEWGGGDIRLHHLWWLKHLPKTAGRTSGVVNNWWQYIMDPNLVGW